MPTANQMPPGTTVITQIIRPSAIVPEAAARTILTGMSQASVYAEGLWLAEPSRWTRYDRAWTGPDEQGAAHPLGTIRVAYGTPTKYEITIYQVTVTQAGADLGLTVKAICDEALAFGELTLAECPRAILTVPPRPFRY